MESRTVRAGGAGGAVRGAVPSSRANLALRVVTAVLVLGSAILHLVIYVQGYKDIPVVGPLFLVNAVAGAVIAVALVLSRHWVWAFLAAGFGGATFAAYLWSKFFGLFGVQEQMWSTTAVLGAITEVGALVLGLALLWGALRTRLGSRPA